MMFGLFGFSSFRLSICLLFDIVHFPLLYMLLFSSGKVLNTYSWFSLLLRPTFHLRGFSVSAHSFPMSDRNFDARSSFAVIFSNSQFFSTSIIVFQTSASDLPISLFRSKTLALLCFTFASIVSCRRNRVTNLYNRRNFGSFSLTSFVISLSALCRNLVLHGIVVKSPLKLSSLRDRHLLLFLHIEMFASKCLH